ncbi:hypothetical protein ACTVMJ_26955, partial [Serratia marcescens]
RLILLNNMRFCFQFKKYTQLFTLCTQVFLPALSGNGSMPRRYLTAAVYTINSGMMPRPHSHYDC